MQKLIILITCLIAISVSAQDLTSFKGSNGKFGFKDKTGKQIIPATYDEIGEFSNGLCLVSVQIPGEYNDISKWGFINNAGKEVIPLQYKVANPFTEEGLASVFLNEKGGFIDKTGKVVIPLKYDAVSSFSDGLARVMLKGKFGFIDKTGKVIIPLKYNDAHSFSRGLAVVRLGDSETGKWGFIDKTGKEVTPIKYGWFSVSGFLSKGLILVKQTGKYGFIDRTGKEVIPLKYDFARDFIDGRAEVELNKRTFYIDETGQEVK